MIGRPAKPESVPGKRRGRPKGSKKAPFVLSAFDQHLLVNYFGGSWNSRPFLNNKALLAKFAAEGHIDGRKREQAAMEKKLNRLLDRMPEAELPVAVGTPVVVRARHGKFRQGK